MSTKPTDFFTIKKGELFCEDVSVAHLARSIETPFYLYSQKGFLTPLKEFQKGLRGIPHQIYFSMKSNSNLAVLNLLYQAGAGLDIVSGGELYRAGQIWAKGNRIVFSGVGKTHREILAALQYDETGIRSFHIESQAELILVNRLAGELQRRAPVLLRFNPDVNPRVHPYIATGLKSEKFGLSRKDIGEIFSKQDSFPWIDFEGLSIHIGSQIESLAPFREAFVKTRDLLDELNRNRIKPMNTVDLGGGLAVYYGKPAKAGRKAPPTIAQYCALIRDVFGNHRKNLAPYEILIEPGRTISANAGVLVTRVLYRKPGPKKDFLIVDASMTELIRPALYQSFHEILPVKAGRGGTITTDVVGPVCESADFLGKNRKLPRSLSSGDALAILSSGAYGMTMASRYNSRPLPSEILVGGKQFRVVRFRENEEDMVNAETV